MRALVRRYVPFEVRLLVAVVRRRIRDARAGIRFARTRSAPSGFPHLAAKYTRPIIDYDGQVQFAAAKRHNLRLLASQLDGTVVLPGETFSIWTLAPRPSLRNGYQAAAGFRNRRLATEVGGSTCLLSTVLYNVALLAGTTIVERHCHSIDLYGERRYFEPGRDAAIEYGYLDLRFRNDSAVPLLLTFESDDASLTGALRSPEAPNFVVDVGSSAPHFTPRGERRILDPKLAPGTTELREAGLDGMEASCWRTVTYDGGATRHEQLEGSVHHAVPAVVAYGPELRPG